MWRTYKPALFSITSQIGKNSMALSTMIWTCYRSPYTHKPFSLYTYSVFRYTHSVYEKAVGKLLAYFMYKQTKTTFDTVNHLIINNDKHTYTLNVRKAGTQTLNVHYVGNSSTCSHMLCVTSNSTIIASHWQSFPLYILLYVLT